ncbi:MAG: YciI family protein [Thermomicrobiaceae bacterium]
MLIIYGNDEDWTQYPESEIAGTMVQHESFTRDLQDAGAFVASDALQPSSTSTTIRMKDNEPLLTDGPFIESKEQIGGYYLIDVENLDQALEWGKRLAAFDGGPVVVWPAIDMEM